MHTFLFEEGVWEVAGEYFDEGMNRAVLRGGARITHGPSEWLNEGRMVIESGGRNVEVESLYRIVPFRKGSDFTSWESANPTLGTLRGHFIVVGNSILSSCRTSDARYSGSEFHLRETGDRYISRGALFSAGGRISSWSLTLTRTGRR